MAEYIKNPLSGKLRGVTYEDALTVPVRKRTRGYRPSASCDAKMDLEE